MRAFWPALVGVLGCVEPIERAPPRPPPTSNPCIVLNPIDFGQVELGGRGDVGLSIANFTTRTSFVTVRPISAPFFVDRTGEFQLEAGETMPLRVSYFPQDGRVHLGELEFIGGRECAPQQVPLRGVGAGSLTSSHTAIDFGQVPFDVPTRRTLTLRNSRREPMTLRVLVEPAVFSAPASVELPPVSEVQVEVSVLPAGGGFVGGSVTFVGPRSDRVQVQLTATAGRPRLEFDPAVLEIPIIPFVAGVPAQPIFSRSSRVSNVGTADLEIHGYEVSSGAELEASVPLIALPPGVSLPITLRFTPGPQPGPRAWQVRLLTNEAEAGQQTLSLSGRVEVVQPCGRVTPTVTPAATSIAVALTNEGASPCLLHDVRLADSSRWAIDAPAQLIIEAGETKTVRVEAPTPGTNGLRFNAFGSPTQLGGVTHVPLEVR